MILISVVLFFAFLVMLGLLVCQSLEIDRFELELEDKEDELEFEKRLAASYLREIEDFEVSVRVNERLREEA